MEEVDKEEAPHPQNHSNQVINQKIISDLMKKVGAFGLYQKISLALFFLASCVCGQYLTITPFLFYQDQYRCTSIPNNFSSCLDYVCSLSPQERVSYLAVVSIKTLANKFGDYRCSDNSNVINLCILIMYVGLIVSYIFISLFGDYFGRKTFIIVGAISSIIGTLFAIFINNIYLASIGLLVGIFGVQIIFGLSFTIISQIVAQQYRQQCIVVLQIFYSIGNLTDTGFYFWLRDWYLIFIYFFIVPIAVFLVCYLIISVDSPIVLVKNLTPEDAIKQFQWIARVNGVQDVQITAEQLIKMKQMYQIRENDEQKASKFTILDLFKYQSLRWMTLALILVQISITFLYFAPNLMLDQFQLSIFINGIVYGSATVIANAIMYFPIKKFYRKYVAFTTLSITLICSVILIFVYHTKTQDQNLSLTSNIGILAALFIITFSITAQYTFFLVYLTQLYPTQVRVLGISLVSLTSAIILSVSSFIIDSAINSGFHVMIVFSIFAVIGLLGSCWLPQTLQKKQSDFIRQLEIKISRNHSERDRQIIINLPTQRGLVQANNDSQR